MLSLVHRVSWSVSALSNTVSSPATVTSVHVYSLTSSASTNSVPVEIGATYVGATQASFLTPDCVLHAVTVAFFTIRKANIFESNALESA